MSAMWERRLLSALIVAPLALVIALSEAEGLVLYVVLSIAGLIALVGGTLGAEWLQARRHRTQG
ncbi:MAG TPA: hypothetical protein VFY04_10360 [Solirubrobacterales bacterium]|nr:hypothetical protein [Solirubrobacterales bacterium]